MSFTEVFYTKENGLNYGNIFFILIFLATIIFIIDIKAEEVDESLTNTTEEYMCRNIKATPSWSDKYGQIFDTGYKEFPNMTYNYVGDLIENETYFLYDPQCIWCQKQIYEFNERWNNSFEQYINSGYAVDCREVLSR